jgi:predicted nucleic acid-binding protein
VLACALAAQVDLMVSGDHDLLSLEEYEGIRIVNPATAITWTTPGLPETPILERMES